MKVRRLKRLNAQQVFRSTLHLNDGGEVSGPNWYFGKKCHDSLRRRYKRVGLWPAYGVGAAHQISGSKNSSTSPDGVPAVAPPSGYVSAKEAAEWEQQRADGVMGVAPVQHQYASEEVGTKYRPICACGWRGRPSNNRDMARGQYAGHIARLSAASDLAAARGVSASDHQTFSQKPPMEDSNAQG